MTFKAGDRVRCINAQSVSGLSLGEIYTVSRIDRYGSLDLLRLGERHELKGYFATRFELAEDETAPPPKTSPPPKTFKVGDIVRCIDATGYEHFGFKNGNLYDVTKVLPGVRAPTMLGFAQLMKVCGTMFASRFELVSRAKADAVLSTDEMRFEKADTRPGGINVIPETIPCTPKAERIKVGDWVVYTDNPNDTNLEASKPYEVAAVEFSTKAGEDRIFLVGHPRDEKTGYHPFWWAYRFKLWSGPRRTVPKDTFEATLPKVVKAVGPALRSAPIMNQTFKPGQRVRCVDDSDSSHKLVKGKIYTIEAVRECATIGGGQPSNLVFDLLETPKAKYPTGWMASRFQLVEPAGALTRRGEAVRRVLEEEARRLTKVGSLDEYSPAPEKPNPLFRAINKRWSNHPSDVLIQLDELKND